MNLAPAQRIVADDPRKLKLASCLRSELDLNVYSTGKIKFHQSVNCFRAWAVDIDDAAMGAGFKVLAGIFVHVG
jgi:hypothetical protein